MHVGMLWFDNTPNLTLKNRIEKAVDYYRRKYHREPNLCLIHPNLIGKDQPDLDQLISNGMDSLTIRPYRPVLPGHLWIGIEDKN